MTGPVTLPAPEATGAEYFDLDAARGALASGDPVVFPPMRIAHATIRGKAVAFCTNFDRDPVQRAHRRGRFYEADDLGRVARMLPPGAHVLDVGANTGNHTLYFAMQAGAARVVVVEPNPLALAPLVASVVLNGLRDIVSLDALGVGLGAAAEDGLFMKRHDRNLGATKMLRGRGGSLRIVPGDALFAAERFDLIKIDVEGMEMDVLAGLEATVARCRPALFVEVDDGNAAAFADWCAARDYAVDFESRHSEGNRNLFVRPGTAAQTKDTGR